ITGSVMRAHLLTGNARYGLGDYRKAAGEYSEALAQAVELKDKATTAQLVANLAEIALQEGRYDDAEARGAEALRLKQELKDEAGRQHSLLTQGQVHAGGGEWPQAEELYRQVLASPDARPSLVVEARAALARLLIKSGRTRDAEAEYRLTFALIE